MPFAGRNRLSKERTQFVVVNLSYNDGVIRPELSRLPDCVGRHATTRVQVLARPVPLRHPVTFNSRLFVCTSALVLSTPSWHQRYLTALDWFQPHGLCCSLSLSSHFPGHHNIGRDSPRKGSEFPGNHPGLRTQRPAIKNQALGAWLQTNLPTDSPRDQGASPSQTANKAVAKVQEADALNTKFTPSPRRSFRDMDDSELNVKAGSTGTMLRTLQNYDNAGFPMVEKTNIHILAKSLEPLIRCILTVRVWDICQDSVRDTVKPRNTPPGYNYRTAVRDLHGREGV
ncbi:hypothetical protein Bbelb_345470 [Branchiostoma belcheri]|nr:hypothetical protein Bbelb_345470 [Branchiostoma belcheri]